jgi:hypothetical protein
VAKKVCWKDKDSWAPRESLQKRREHWQGCRKLVSRIASKSFTNVFKSASLSTESKTKLHGVSPRAKYTDRAIAPCRRSDCQRFADRGCHVVSVTDPYGRILGFLDRSRYFFLQVFPQLYSRGWVDPVPDPLLLRKSGNAGNRTRDSGSVAKNSDH